MWLHASCDVIMFRHVFLDVRVCVVFRLACVIANAMSAMLAQGMVMLVTSHCVCLEAATSGSTGGGPWVGHWGQAHTRDRSLRLSITLTIFEQFVVLWFCLENFNVTLLFYLSHFQASSGITWVF